MTYKGEIIMKKLIIFRGAPGCGKSTIINKYNLKDYTLSADELRLMCQAPITDENGVEGISQKHNSFVWRMLFAILELRMSTGSLTVIDATNSTTREINKYIELCDKYDYKLYCIDMTNLPIEECKYRNANRLPKYKRVPEFVIDRMYENFKNQPINNEKVKVVSLEDIEFILK